MSQMCIAELISCRCNGPDNGPECWDKQLKGFSRCHVHEGITISIDDNVTNFDKEDIQRLKEYYSKR